MDQREYSGGRMRAVTDADRRYNIEKERLTQRKNKSFKKRSKDVYQRALNKYKNWYDESKEMPVMKNRLVMQSVACLGILALLVGARLLPFGASNQFVETVKTVATTSMEDESIGEALGKLKFVSNMIPDSVLVFWNRTSTAAPETLSLPFEDGQLAMMDGSGGWFIGSGAVHALADGKVSSVTRSAYGGYQAIVEHGGGLCSVYEPLVGVRVTPGEEVREGQSFATPVEENELAKLRIELTLGEENVELESFFES